MITSYPTGPLENVGVVRIIIIPKSVITSYPTGPLENVGVVRIIVALTGHLDPPEPVVHIHVRLAFPLGIRSVGPPVDALDHARLGGMAARGPPNAGELGDGGTAAAFGHLALVEGEGRHIGETDTLVVVMAPGFGKP